MGISTSGAALLLFLAVLLAFGTLHGATDDAGEVIGDALDDERELDRALQRSAIRIASAEFADGETVLIVENAGSTTLSVAATDVLIDGTYYPPEEYATVAVGSRSDPTVWRPGERLRIVVPTPRAGRAKVVTERGLASVAAVLADGRELVFAAGDDLRSIPPGGTADTYGVDATVTAPAVENFRTSGTNETAFINGTGQVAIAEESGTVTVLAGGARTAPSRLSVGHWRGDPTAVFYVNASTGSIRRVTADGDDAPVASVSAEGVAGTGDVDGDGTLELVFGGESPSGSSRTINYVEPNGTVVGTGASYGANSGIGIGEPHDFDGDGRARVPIVDGGQEVALVAGDGTVTTLTSTAPASKGPLGSFDWDTDGAREIVFTNASGSLAYVDDVAGTNTVTTLTDADGNTVPADADTGAA